MSIQYTDRTKQSNNDIFYHGTTSLFPFPEFDLDFRTRSLVTSKGLAGVYFTSNPDTAEYYSEFLICTVRIDISNAKFINSPRDIDMKTAPEVMEFGINHNEIIVIKKYVDGQALSNIVCVPKTQLKLVKILDWNLLYDYDIRNREEYYIELDKIFDIRHDDESSISMDDIVDTLDMMNYDSSFIIRNDIFKKYIESRNIH